MRKIQNRIFLTGTVTPKGTSKSDLQKDNVILKAKNKYLRRIKTFEDRVILLDECTGVFQNLNLNLIYSQ